MKNNSMKKIMIPMTVAVMSAMVGCASTKPVERTNDQATTANRVDNKIGQQTDASWYTEVTFDKGSASLDAADREALDSLVQKSMDSGKVDEIKIISWADQEYPGKKTKVPESQKNLADNRNTRIKNYLKATYPSLDFAVYNMAERPNAIQELFNTSDAKIKKSMERAGISVDSDNRVNYAKKESTALVLSILK